MAVDHQLVTFLEETIRMAKAGQVAAAAVIRIGANGLQVHTNGADNVSAQGGLNIGADLIKTMMLTLAFAPEKPKSSIVLPRNVTPLPGLPQ
jgi:hypothetical protein